MAKRTVQDSRGFFQNRRLLLLTVAGTAVCFRFIVLVSFSGSMLANAVWSDAATYDQLARRIIATGDWLGNQPFFLTPLYPWFLAIIYSLGGPDLLTVRIVQAAAGVMTVILVFLAAERIFSRPAAFWAGMLAAVYGPFLLNHNLLLVETLKVLFLTGTFVLLLLAQRKSTPFSWFAAGLSMGLSVLCRPSDLLTALVVMAWIWFFGVSSRRERLRRAVLFAFGAGVIILPVTLRNLSVTGEFILVTSNGGLNLYLGNNPDAVGVYYNVDRLDLASDPDGRAYLELTLGRPVTHGEASSIFRDRALSYIAGQPFGFLSLIGKKILLFFHFREISQLGYNYSFVSDTAVPVLRYLPTFLVAGVLGLLGAVLSASRWKELFLLYGVLCAQIAGVVLFFVTDRFRLSAIPFLMICAGYAVAVLLERLGNRDWSEMGKLAGIGLLLVPPMTVFNYDIPPEYSLEWENTGVMHFNAREYPAALRAFQESMRYKDSYHLRNNIGNVYLATGQTDAALEQFTRGETMHPRQPASSFGIGTVHASRQEWAQALAAFDRSISINSRFAPAYLNRGLTLFYMQRYPEALESLRMYVRLEPDRSKLTSVNADIRNLERIIAGEKDPQPGR